MPKKKAIPDIIREKNGSEKLNPQKVKFELYEKIENSYEEFCDKKSNTKKKMSSK